MRVIILGANVIGVSSAWYLAQAGHEVTVIDRQPGPALETSFANAGEISPGYASPWAAPGIPAKAISWLLMHQAPLNINARPDLAKIEWVARMLMNCTSAAYAVNKSRMVRLAEYSREVPRDLRASTGITYDERTQGTLQLFRTQKQVDAAYKDIKVLKADGVPFQVLDADQCIAAEPGLAPNRAKITGGLRLPGDETCDCHIFTNRLADMAQAAGVTFRYGVSTDRLEQVGDRIAAVHTSAGRLAADSFVLGLGSYFPALARPFGMRLPVYPVKGYSITVPIIDADRAPVSTVMDETFKIAITRLGDRIRVGGMAKIAGFNTTLHARSKATLQHSVGDLFGGAGDQSKATFWSGLRPMTPDGTPILGRSTVVNFVPQHRARHAGLDDGGGVRSGAGRHDLGPRDGHRHNRSGLCPVSAQVDHPETDAVPATA